MSSKVPIVVYDGKVKSYVAVWKSPASGYYVSQSSSYYKTKCYPNDPDPKVYCGSGRLWLKHIKQAGLPELISVDWFDDQKSSFEFECLKIIEYRRKGIHLLNRAPGGWGKLKQNSPISLQYRNESAVRYNSIHEACDELKMTYGHLTTLRQAYYKGNVNIATKGVWRDFKIIY